MSEAIRRLMSEAIRRLMSEAIRPNQTGAAVVSYSTGAAVVSYSTGAAVVSSSVGRPSACNHTHMALRWYNLLEGRRRPNLSQIQVIQRHPAAGT